jgi:hypothetical protein
VRLRLSTAEFKIVGLSYSVFALAGQLICFQLQLDHLLIYILRNYIYRYFDPKEGPQNCFIPLGLQLFFQQAPLKNCNFVVRFTHY